MPKRDRDGLFDRRVLLDMLVNVIPLGILLAFIAMFVTLGPYPKVPLYVTVQISLVAIPGLVLIVLTYYAVRAVTEAERSDSPDLPPGYSARDAEAAPAVGDD